MCYLANDEYRTGLDIIKPLAGRAAAGTAHTRATVYNSTALGLTMLNIGAPANHPQLVEADHLSSAALGMFPCILGYRMTRAIILAATERPLQALQLLEYPLFHSARPKEQSQRAATMAFAYRQLGNLPESAGAAALALQLDPTITNVLRTLGVAPSPSAHPLATAPSSPATRG
jgi:hypothetical protein